MRVCLLLASLLSSLPVLADAPARAAPCSESLAGQLPARSAAAPDAGGFLARIAALDAGAREQAIRDELLGGNIPQFLRRLVPVVWNALLPSGRTIEVTVCVMPDYLAVGSDQDFLFVPMALSSALLVAKRFGFVLPTRRIVDAIYARSAVQLAPQPLPPGPQMRSTGYYRAHDELIREQRAGLDAAPGKLTAGHKKDLVLTPRLWQHLERVAIYGWHRGEHQPIQPLSMVHGGRYADYSHGARMVSSTAWIDGVPRSILELLADPELSWALSDEGPIPRPAELISSLEQFPLLRQ